MRGPLRGATALCLLLAAGAAAAEPVTVNSQPIQSFSRIDPTKSDFGALRFRGGLVLSSAVPGFGGWSGLRLDATGGTFTAVSDRANWLTGRIVYEGERPVALADADFAPVLGEDGQPLDGTRHDDTEGLEVSGDTAWVSVEGSGAVLRFELADGVAAARGRALPMPKAVKGLPRNAGLEAIGLVPEGGDAAGRLLGASEEAYGPDGHHAAWLVARDGKGAPESLSVTMRDGYAVTDLTFLPDGDLVVLERRYRPPLSLNMRLRRIPRADIRAGAVLDGTVLMEASLAEDIDNMEGVSAHRAADGTTVLTLISDDNQSMLQRTVLLQFGLRD